MDLPHGFYLFPGSRVLNPIISFFPLVDWGEKPITATVTAIGFAVGEPHHHPHLHCDRHHNDPHLNHEDSDDGDCGDGQST